LFTTPQIMALHRQFRLFSYADLLRFPAAGLHAIFRACPDFSQTEATNKDVRTPAEKRLVFDFRIVSGRLWYGEAAEPEDDGAGRLHVRRSPVVVNRFVPYSRFHRHSFTVGGTKTVGIRNSLILRSDEVVDRTTACRQQLSITKATTAILRTSPAPGSVLFSGVTTRKCSAIS